MSLMKDYTDWRTVKSKHHLLELTKRSFYADFFDVESYSKVFLAGGKVTLIKDNGKIIAFREFSSTLGEDVYYEVDRYTKVGGLDVIEE